MSDTLPTSIQNNRRPDRWLSFLPDGTLRLAVGKVELGQGVITALAQIAAEELDIPLDRIAVLSGDTEQAPDEGQTTSSQSIEMSGRSVRLISAEVRARFVERLARRLNCGAEEIAVTNGAFLRGDAPVGQDYWSFAPEVDLAAEATGSATPKPRAAYRIVGKPVPRRDLPAKITGAAFIHDMVLPGMRHARILRQPGRGARLAALDEAAIRRAAKGDFDILRIGDFVAFLGAREDVVQRAAAAAPDHANWKNVPHIPPGAEDAAWLIDQPAQDRRFGAETAPPPGRVLSATYSRPYIAHAAMAPSCALAWLRDGTLEVWSHTQGVYPLRGSIAAVLGMKPAEIVVHHVQGAGCYGHNGADDVAVDAALIARAHPGQPIRVQWRREEEFGFEPVGTAMVVKIDAVLDDAGKPIDWSTEIWSGTHVQRPSSGGNMLAHEALPVPAPDPRPTDPPEAAGGGGTRNAIPLYDIPAHRILHHLVLHPPVRTSALRGLGALPNIFALESFMDELALAAGADPLAYRLSLISDRRARRLLETLGEKCNWAGRGAGGQGSGMGLAWARYKNRAAYAAVAVVVEVDQEVRLRHVWCTADAGLVINPDGGLNQLEGGIVQAASFTLKEQVKLGPDGIASRDWDSYPILRFSEIPPIDITLIDAADEPSLGMGECTIAPTAAAIGNAVAHALGSRIRAMPLSRERIMAHLLAG